MAKLIETTHDKNGKLFTAESFLDQLRRSNSDWWDGDEENSYCRWVFRGHKDAKWELIPSAFRDIAFNQLRPLIDNLKGNEHFLNPWFLKQSEPAKSAIYKYTAFCVAVQRFYNLSLELGLTDEIIDLKAPFHFTSRHSLHNHYYITCSHQIVSLAQHHGIPTPFLDWTRKPEVALHFASTFEPDEDVSDIAIFALKVSNLSSTRPDLRDRILNAFVRSEDRAPDRHPRLPFDVVLDAPAKNSYLAAQHGIFTMSNRPGLFFQSGKYSGLETEIADLYGEETKILNKYVLSKDEIPKLRLLLEREGLTGAHLMPTFDKVADAIRSRW